MRRSFGGNRNWSIPKIIVEFPSLDCIDDCRDKEWRTASVSVNGISGAWIYQGQNATTRLSVTIPYICIEQ
jgi:hypothetical protein